MRITIFGASGKVGRLVVEGALDAGYDVTAFAHHDPRFAEHARLKVAQGDVHSSADVAKAVKGADVVISALGSWGTGTKDIVSSGTANIIPAMEAAGARRVISLTGADARAEGDRLSLMHRLTHAAIQVTPPRKILADGERHIRRLEHSGLDWTVLRSPIMNEKGDPEGFRLGTGRPVPWATINRRSVALAMLGLIGDDNHSRQAPFITRA
jgi:putative NADH-flavin reductase